jgi:hypothetical protein
MKALSALATGSPSDIGVHGEAFHEYLQGYSCVFQPRFKDLNIVVLIDEIWT